MSKKKEDSGINRNLTTYGDREFSKYMRRAFLASAFHVHMKTALGAWGEYQGWPHGLWQRDDRRRANRLAQLASAPVWLAIETPNSRN